MDLLLRGVIVLVLVNSLVKGVSAVDLLVRGISAGFSGPVSEKC